MGLQSKIATFVRWVLTWPVLVILALNIENATSQAGYGTLINQHWKETIPVLKEVYSIALSDWIIYPALIFAGAVLYEWVRTISNKIETDGSGYHRWWIKTHAETLSSAFCKKGLYRKITKIKDLELFNDRLRRMDLPTVPNDFKNHEEDNRIFGAYLSIVAKGQFDHAKNFISHSNLIGDSELQSPLSIGSETPL